MTTLLRRILDRCRRSRVTRRICRLRREARKRIARYPPPYRLHLGCGLVRFEGWINIDRAATSAPPDVLWDVTHGLPVDDGSCALIYCEHLLEHLKTDPAAAFLAECRRALAPDGTLRIAMPSLETVVQKYLSEDWRDQDWLTWPEHRFIQTRAEMINISFRWWGHEWLYDREELHRRLREAGFARIADAAWGRSDVPDLNRRETRADSLLICEARK